MQVDHERLRNLGDRAVGARGRDEIADERHRRHNAEPPDEIHRPSADRLPPPIDTVQRSLPERAKATDETSGEYAEETSVRRVVSHREPKVGGQPVDLVQVDRAQRQLDGRDGVAVADGIADVPGTAHGGAGQEPDASPAPSMAWHPGQQRCDREYGNDRAGHDSQNFTPSAKPAHASANTYGAGRSHA